MIAGLDSSGREESPDTDLRQQEKWATRLVTPGELLADATFRWLRLRFTESATENRPPRKRAAVTGGRETCSSSEKSAFAGKGEKVG
jgi:hypothetical protein